MSERDVKGLPGMWLDEREFSRAFGFGEGQFRTFQRDGMPTRSGRVNTAAFLDWYMRRVRRDARADATRPEI